MKTYDSPPGEQQLNAEVLDAELLAAALRDRSQFAPLYDRYRSEVYAYCSRRLDVQDAEDVTSHIFLQAFRHLDSCRSPSFRAWLFRIAHNAVIDRLRSGKPAIALDETLALVSSERSPEAHALEADQKYRLECAIRALPPAQRAAVELRLSGFTGVECADRLGKRPDAVRMLHHRAFITLRSALEDCSPDAR